MRGHGFSKCQRVYTRNTHAVGYMDTMKTIECVLNRDIKVSSSYIIIKQHEQANQNHRIFQNEIAKSKKNKKNQRR